MSRLEKYNFSQGTIFLYQGKPQPNEDPLHLTPSKYLITQIAYSSHQEPSNPPRIHTTSFHTLSTYTSNNTALLSKEIHNCSLTSLQMLAMPHTLPIDDSSQKLTANILCYSVLCIYINSDVLTIWGFQQFSTLLFTKKPMSL